LFALGIAVAVVAVGVAIRLASGRGEGGLSALSRGTSRSPRTESKKRRKRISAALGGADALAASLGSLGEDFVVLSSVRTGQGDLPAVVLGPTGLWALATTNVKGTVSAIEAAVTVDGQETELASGLWRRAHALADAMAITLFGEAPPVQAVLAFDPGAVRLDRREAMGVRLLMLPELRGVVADSRVRFDPATLADLRGALMAAVEAGT
jgi:hypothetical protein